MKKIAAIILSMIFVLSGMTPIKAEESAEILDTIHFGNTSSENAHNFSDHLSKVIRGGIDNEPARILLPEEPVNNYGGSVTFNMKVDPDEQNYFTVKLWGNDTGDHVNLFLMVDGRDAGYSNMGDYVTLDMVTSEGNNPGGYVYRTVPIPVNMTKGREEVELSIKVYGQYYSYTGLYRQITVPSRGIYTGYTHTTPYFEPPADEKQKQSGVDYSKKTMYAGTNDALIMRAVKDKCNEYLESTLNGMNTKQSDMRNSSEQYFYLAYSLHIPWTITHNERYEDAIKKLIEYGDEFAYTHLTDPSVTANDGTWGGKFYGLGQAVYYVYDDLNKTGCFEEIINTGQGKMTRRQAWGETIAASCAQAQNQRKTIGNQVMHNIGNAFKANAGLLRLAPEMATSREEALVWAYTCTGAVPYIPSQEDGTLSTTSFGEEFPIFTEKGGLGREPGHVFTYGEMLQEFSEIMMFSAEEPTDDPEKYDSVLRERVHEMSEGRGVFRYPMNDKDGNIKMVGEAIISTRNDYFPGEIMYGDRINQSDPKGLFFAARTKDPMCIAYVKQGIEDGWIQWSLSDFSTNYHKKHYALDVPDDFEYIKNYELPEEYENVELPMTDGQEDFVYDVADNGVVAFKDGDTRVYVNTYYRAQHGIGAVGRAHIIKDNYQQTISFNTDVQYRYSGDFYQRNNYSVSGLNSRGPDIDEPVNFAWYGDIKPIPQQPDTVSSLTITDVKPDDPYAGRSSMATAKIGQYMIGMNMDLYDDYTFDMPAGETKAINLATGETVTGSSVTLSPHETIVLKFDHRIDFDQQPYAPTYIHGVASNGRVYMEWNEARGADTYTVKRRVPGGEFEVVVDGLTSLSYIDNSAENGKEYEYTVTAINENGESIVSTVVPVQLQDNYKIPSKWTSIDFGTETKKSYADINGNTIKLTGAGTDLWNTADNGAFLYDVVEGNFSIIAQIDWEAAAKDQNAKAGIMIRQDDTEESRNVFLGITGKNTVTFNVRAQRGASTSTKGSKNEKYNYIKLDRFDSKFTAYVSNDGVNWEQIGQADVYSIHDMALVGCAVSSKDSDDYETAVFSNIQMTEPIKTRGQYQLVNKATGEALTQSGENVILKSADESIEQIWIIEEGYAVGGYIDQYQILTRSELRDLTADDSGYSIQQDKRSDSTMYAFEGDVDGYYKIKNNGTNKYLSAYDGELTQSNEASSDYELWKLVRVE